MAQMQEPIKKEIYRLIIQPGLFRDYTIFSSPGCTDMQWFRFYHNRLRRMGGYQYVAGLPTITVGPNFVASDGPHGNSFTQPSYPGKQYSNQDLTKPFEATQINSGDLAYSQYNINSDEPATFYNEDGLTDTGYRIPRKAYTVILDNIETVVITSDYSQVVEDVGDQLFGGIAFCRLQNIVQPSLFVNGFFPNNYGYLPNNTYSWTIDSINNTTGFITAGSSTYVVVHPSCPSGSITDTTDNYVFIILADDMIEGAKLVPLSANPPIGTPEGEFSNTEIAVSGGVVAVGPFLFAYGNNGLILNCDIDNPFYWADPASPEWQSLPGLSNAVNIGNSKIVKGVNYKGTNTYAALFWSLDSLILANFIGTPSVFSYTVLATNISILAQNSVVETHGNYYWLGDSRFFTFDGQVHELNNMQNRNWFWSNLNYKAANKTWGILNPKFSEVIWFVPMYGSTECNWMQIYNYESQVWYDCELSRGAGVYSSILGSPLWINNKINSSTQEYDMYLHETVSPNAIDKQRKAMAIYSSFTTADIGYMSNPQNGAPKSEGGWYQSYTELISVMPDFVGSGIWTFETISRQYPNVQAEYISFSTPIEFTNTTSHIDMRVQDLVIQLRFTNNTVNSDWSLMGDFMLTTNIGDSNYY